MWGLDGVAAVLEDVTVGHGAGGRTELLNRLTDGTSGQVVLLDDDVEFDGSDLAAFVDAAAALDLDLAQPAHTWDSAFSHLFTLARPWIGARLTTFVEIGPVVYLSARGSARLLPLPEITKMGWGIDVLWSDILRAGELRGGVIDRLPIRHLGTVGSAYASGHEADHVQRMLRKREVRHIASLQRTLQRFPPAVMHRRPSVGPDGVAVGPIAVADRPTHEIVSELVDPPRLPYVAFAVHVGALGLFDHPEYLDAMAMSDLTYADGHAIVLLAKTAGARRIERTATTDIGYDVLRGVASRQHGVRVALIGGTSGLAERAGAALERTHAGARVVFVRDGFRPFVPNDFAALRSSAPDVVFVGMGMPREAIWVQRHLGELPPSRIITCGGWFGFVSGDERRAPRFLQRLRLEWLFRTIQSPRRLAGRYASGLVRTVLVALRVRRERRGRP